MAETMGQSSLGTGGGGFLPAAVDDSGEASVHDYSDDDDDFGLFVTETRVATTTTTTHHSSHSTEPPPTDSAEPLEASTKPDEKLPPVAYVETSMVSSSSSPSLFKKSSLKRISSYGCMEATGENIPICSKKSSWKTLPVPSGNMRRTESTASFFHEENATASTMKRNVSFAKIHVRDYALTVGDNPACCYGTPVQLDWKYTQHEPLELDLYEDMRPARRNVRQMHLNSYQRQHILALNNVPDTEIKAAKRQAKKIQRQRAVTSYFVPVMKIEDMVESAARKAKRLVNNKQKQNQGNTMNRSKSVGWLYEDDTITSVGAHSIQTI
jgi:hypothetical protein